MALESVQCSAFAAPYSKFQLTLHVQWEHDHGDIPELGKVVITINLQGFTKVALDIHIYREDIRKIPPVGVYCDVRGSNSFLPQIGFKLKFP